MRQEPGLDRVIIQCPPQHGKSLLASQNFPAKFIGEYPEKEIVAASATASLAEEFGGKVRNKIASPEFNNLFPNVQLMEDSRAKGRWMTTQGGGYYGVGIGGQLFGRGGHLGMIDDPYASWDDGQSDLVRKKVWEWYNGTFLNRIRPGGSIVVIQHRVSEDDLIGLLMASKGSSRWKVIKITADIDNPPWPDRYSSDILKEMRESMPLRMWNALYMQDPAPDDGIYFKRANFNFYSELPTRLNTYITGDFAVSDGQGDYTDIAVWGVDHLGKCYMVDWWFGQKTSDVWVDKVLDFAEMYGPTAFIAEGGQIRRGVEPWLEKRMVERGVFVSPQWLPSSSEKTVLCQTFRSMTEMGRVYFPHTDKADRVIEQCVKFPGGRYDDAVDACSLFGRYISRTWKASEQVVEPELAWDAPLQIVRGQLQHG